MKNSIHILSVLLCTSLLFNNALIAQNSTYMQEKMNIFRHTINRYKGIYERFKKCRENQCTQEEKERVNQELNKIANNAVVAAMGIITFIAGSAAIYLVIRQKKLSSQNIQPSPQQSAIQPSSGQQPTESPKEEIQPLQQQIQETQEKQKQQEAELKRQQDEQAALKRQIEEERRQLEEKRRQLEEEKRLEQERQKQEQKRQQEEDRQRKEEERRKKEEEEQLGKLKEKIHSTLVILKNIKNTHHLGQIPWLEELQNINVNNLTHQEALNLSNQIMSQFYGPTDKFIDLLKKIEVIKQNLPNQDAFEGESLQLYNTATSFLNVATTNYQNGNIQQAQMNAQNALNEFKQLFEVLKKTPKTQTWGQWGWSWLGYE